MLLTPELNFPLREKYPNAEFFRSVFSCIQFEYRKIQTGKISVFGHFSRSIHYSMPMIWWNILWNSLMISRNSRWQMFFKKGVLKNIHRKTPVLESLFNKVAGQKPFNFIKKDFQMQQDFLSVSDHFGTLCVKELKVIWIVISQLFHPEFASTSPC